MAAAQDRFDLQRFLDAQDGVYPQALAEMRAGEKRSHWMWFIFPQISGLGSSSMAQRYAVRSMDEAVAYLRHPVLGTRLREITAAVNAHAGTAGTTPGTIFGYPDDLKFHSSVTLFAGAADADGEKTPVFQEALGNWFGGAKDRGTLDRLRQLR